MARQGIFTGFTPNDGLGDSLASGAVKVNDNFSEIYATFGDGTNLSVNAGSAGTWTKAGTNGITTSKYVGIGTETPTSQFHVSGNSLLSGITTGTFVGDGSGLTGVTATGSGVVLKNNGTLIGVAQSINFTDRIEVGTVFGGNVDVYAVDYVSYATVSGISSTAVTAGVATRSDYATLAGIATYAGTAGVATFATTAGIVTYAAASGVATEAGNAVYSTTAGVSSYTPIAGVSTLSGYATGAGIATVAENLTGTPSITIDNINSAIGIVTMPGQGSKMRFDFDATGDLPTSTSWRGMFAYTNNTKRAYVSTGTTMGGYNGWRQLISMDEYGNYQTTGILTASFLSGDGSLITNLPANDSIWRVNSSGIHTMGGVGIGTTTASGGALNVRGNFNLDGRLDGTATNNTLPFLWSAYSSLPTASDVHGQFAHAHDTESAYFAHDGNWVQLVNKELDSTVGTGTENFAVGVITATTYYGDGSNLTGVSGGGGNSGYANTAGIATVAQGLTGSPFITVAGVNASGIVTASSFVGDGSGLTGVTASGTGVVVKDGGSTVGTAGTIDFGANLAVSPASAGVVTVTGTSAPSVVTLQEEGSNVGTASTINFVGAGVTATITGGIGKIDITGSSFTGAAATISNVDISEWNTAYGWGNHASGGYLTGIGGLFLKNLSDVNGSTPTAGDVLKWDGAEWAPGTDNTGGGGGGSSVWTTVASGIKTTSNVGIGTDVANIKLNVEGDVNVSGALTAASITGGGAGIPTIESPNNINLNAVAVAISSDFSVGENTSIGGTCGVAGTVSAAIYHTGTVVGDGSDRSYAIRYRITSNGNSGYNFSGPGCVNTTDNPNIYLQRGLTYIFENTTTTAHPFAIRYSTNGTGYGSTYLSGSQSGTQIFTVPFDAPATLNYQCTIHAGMVGTITIA